MPGARAVRQKARAFQHAQDLVAGVGVLVLVDFLAADQTQARHCGQDAAGPGAGSRHDVLPLRFQDSSNLGGELNKPVGFDVLEHRESRDDIEELVLERKPVLALDIEVEKLKVAVDARRILVHDLVEPVFRCKGAAGQEQGEGAAADVEQPARSTLGRNQRVRLAASLARKEALQIAVTSGYAGQAGDDTRVGDVPEILGTCDQRFTGVADTLRNNFLEHGELGAAVALVISGEPVVDIWAGWMDDERTRPWQADTLVDVFSVGKAMATICLLVLLERGKVELQAPVARYWPEFAARGKDQVTVQMLLSHQAGVPAIRRLLADDAIYDWDQMSAAVAAEEPWWQPGRGHGYHVNTFGFLVGELVRRLTGSTIGKFFRSEVADVMGADFHFGIPAQEDQRTAEYLFGEDASPAAGRAEAERLFGDDEERKLLLARVYLNPPGISGIGTVNSRAWRAAEIPSANGHASARGVARIYSALACGGEVDGIRLLEPETIELATREASGGVDFVLGRPSRFGLGFQLTQPERRLGPNPRSFGHFGAGGSLGFADPDERLAFAYTLNRSGPRWQNPRNRSLVDAVYSALGYAQD